MPTTTGKATHPENAFDPLRNAVQDAVNAAYPEQLRRLHWTRPEIEAHQRTALRALLSHAAEHSPFHARRLAGLNLADVDPTDLTSLPIMTKRNMMADLDGVFTDRRLTRTIVEDALARTTIEPVPILGSYTAFTSGGSSGERAVFVFDERANVQVIASVTRPLVARLHAAGGPPPGGLPIAMVGAASAVHLTGAAEALSAGGRLPMRYLRVPVTRPLPQIVEQLNAMQPAAVAGYPTVLARLAAERLVGRLRIRPVIVTCSSEPLTTDLRAVIRAGFNLPVVDNFASTEGLIGLSAPDDEVITFAEDGCIVELVDERNRPVPPGTPSSKALVTNLSNRVQPLIRYELTDSFVRQPAAAEHGYLRATVQGRSDDAFAYGDGLRIHPLVIRSVLVRSPGIAEYQVRQTPRGIEVLAVTTSALDVSVLDVPALEGRLAAALRTAGLDGPAVTVRTATELKRHSHTGKLRRFVPLP